MTAPKQVRPEPFSALVVDANDQDRADAAAGLQWAGFTVSATSSYQAARTLLRTRPPLVLVTEIRLGDFNGIQLAMHAASARPDMTIIVTSGLRDRELKREAERYGATFAPKPLAREDLLAAVYRTARRRPTANGRLEPIEPPFERRRAERRRAERRARAAASVSVDRRSADRRRDVASLLQRAAELS